MKLYRINGTTFTVMYLKECLRLCQKTLGGELSSSLSEPRVATRRGLPLIIPGVLRLEIEKKSRIVVKVTLTILSVFRVMSAAPKIKLETITSPSSGLVTTLPELNFIFPRLKKFIGLKANTYFNMGKSPYVSGQSLLTLTTAGPNCRSQMLGYPVDALALSVHPTSLAVFEAFSKATGCIDL